ncbi:MAG TPA: hypothetical protein RMH99_03875 [Sandaracinaceae bacterium LLY-WYZ-13_1]|nr:hypothetical protein [Sandaracinaceae bacterium LLY-WYZ-13_1]
MDTTSSRTSDGSPPETGGPEARITALRAELDATAERTRQAVIQYEIGHLSQHALGDESQAVREYLGAYNRDPQFRPPLIALVSIFERRRSSKNLLRLYDAEARSATTAREAASALADRAVLMADQLGEAEEARQLLEAAFEQAAEAPDIALLLEAQLLSEGDLEAAMAIVEARADLVRDPVLATLLRLEVARHREETDDVEGALSVLRSAVTTPAARWRVLSQLERLARRAERWPELIVALEGRAKLAVAEARGEDQGQASGAFSVKRFSDEARAGAEAAALYREAGRLRASRLGDPTGAVRDYDEALKLRPDDALLRYERMLACELAGDPEGAAAEAAQLLDAGAEGPAAAALRFRLAERAQAEGDVEAAKREMRAVEKADPGSAVAAAMLDDLLRATGDAAAAVEHLAERAEAVEGEARAQRYWEAAHLAADRLSDGPRARALFAKAAEASEAPATILREGYAAALRLGDPEGARAHGEALLAQDIEDEERSALLRDLHELLRLVVEDRAAADAFLAGALEVPAAGAWAPDIARLYAARAGNASLLAAAHHALADRAADDETAAAHLCAAARTEARAGDADAAVESLRGALERSPTHPYAVALLEEVLRARGDAEEVVRLLREAAEKADAPRAAETRLLLAGAAAEAADDVDKAVQAYEEAAERAPTSLAPLLALKRLAEGRDDKALTLKALEALSQREIAAGEPGRHTLALGEHYDLFGGEPARAEEPLRTALESESVGLHAAVDLALLPVTDGDEAPRLAGLTRLLSHVSDEARAGVLREAAGAALTDGELGLAEELLDDLRERAPHDRWAPLGRLRLLAQDPKRAAERGDAWMALGHATDDPEVAAEILLSGLRAQMIGTGEDAIDDAVILAHEVMAVAPDSLPAAVALDETLSAGDDPDGRASALGSWLGRSGATGRLALESAHGRALGAAGRSRESLEALLKVAVREPDDLASWESIRVCARDCEAWEPLVEACDRLAHLVDDPELKMLLLEESAATLMDELRQTDRAERRLRRVLAIDARRPIAYGRLHDLLAEREDDAGLLELVSARIELVDDVAELAKLFYEQARLLRSLGLREDALGALDNLLMLEGDHVGGLALLVELQVQEENWAGAVEALRSLASAEDVPDSQRRIARLGAADFLETKLDATEEAWAELAALEEVGLADRPIRERMASIAVQLERPGDAVAALERAIEDATKPAAVAKLSRRVGAIHAEHRLDGDAAIAAYRRALEAAPTDLVAGQALADLLSAPERAEMSQAFEQAIRLRLDEDPTDPELLRRLRRAAAWRGDRGLEAVALSALATLGEASEDERAELEPLLGEVLGAGPRGALGSTEFDALRAPGDGGPALALGAAVGESVAEMDGLEPSGFGLGRGDLAKGHPAEAELAAIGGAFGLPEAPLFVGGDDPGRLDLMPYYKGKPAWVIGRGIRGPLSADQRFTAGFLAAGARLGVAPLVRRGPGGAATALFAAAAAAEVPLAAGEGRAGMAETTRRLYKAMPRRVRKSLPDLVRSVGGDGRAIDAWAHLVVRSAQHAGLLMANDLDVSLRRVLGTAPDRGVVLDVADARDMLLFWLSPGALALRQRLGLST